MLKRLKMPERPERLMRLLLWKEYSIDLRVGQLAISNQQSTKIPRVIGGFLSFYLLYPISYL